MCLAEERWWASEDKHGRAIQEEWMEAKCWRLHPLALSPATVQHPVGRHSAPAHALEVKDEGGLRTSKEQRARL